MEPGGGVVSVHREVVKIGERELVFETGAIARHGGENT